MDLRPILDLIDTLDVIFKNDEFSWFSIFWIVGFDTSDRPYGVIRPNIGRLMLFSKKVHRNLFPNLAGVGLTQIRHLGSIFYEKTRKKWILWYVMCRIFYGRRIFYGSRNFYHRKVHNLSYMLHMYGFFISHVDQKLSTFEIQKSFDSLVFFGFIIWA